MTMSKASSSSTLQCLVTVLSPRHIVTSTPPKEWMVEKFILFSALGFCFSCCLLLL